MGAYMMMLGGSSFFASVIAGFIGDGQGWQWVLYWCAIFNAVAFVILFFFFEETMYYRGNNVENIAAQEEVAVKGGAVTPDEEKHSANVTSITSPQRSYRKKTYTQKLALWTIIPKNQTSSLPIFIDHSSY
jgi:MFS family permease